MGSIVERYVELHPRSGQLHQRALQLFPDGVTHDLRRSVPFPLYVERASGSRKWDVDGNELVDYVMGHGALLLGHQHPGVVEAVVGQTRLGTHYGASHEAEVRWGELVRRLVPSAERLRFTSSGTEATMMALRLARAFTGREKIVRLREHFHGWNDSVYGQPRLEETAPVAAGLPAGTLAASIVLPQNDVEALERTLVEDRHAIAAMILEPTGAHWGTDPIEIDYVRAVRELTSRHDVLLIFDEVITGFRVSPGGAQQVYGITPDVTTLAKILGGGLPGGCVAGRAAILDQIALRDNGGARIAHPGTFNANPISASAGAACLSIIADGKHQSRAAEAAAELARGMNRVFVEESIAGCVYGQSSMLHIALGMDVQPPDGYSWGLRALTRRPPPPARETAAALRLGLLNEGIDIMGTGMMVSSAHGIDDTGRSIEAFRATLRAMKIDRLLT